MNVKPNTQDAKPVDNKRSHHVRPQDLPWEKMRFPGCQTKTLLFDPKSGLATVLIKMEPGATLPDHEHVLIEQTYVLEGRWWTRKARMPASKSARRVRLASGGQPARRLVPEGRHDDRDVPGAQQILREGRQGDRRRWQGLAIGLGTRVIGLV